MFYWRSRRAERIRTARGVLPPVGAGPRPARRVPLPFPSAPRRGGPRGRPPQHTPRPLGLYLRAGCGPNDFTRSRGQLRNRGRTLYAPTKNIIRCRGRMISAPAKSGNPVWETIHVRPMKNGNPTSWEEPIRPARGVPSPVGAGPRPARRVRLLFTAAPRRGGPCGRPPQHTPRPLGMCPRAGCGLNVSVSEETWTSAESRAHTVRPYKKHYPVRRADDIRPHPTCGSNTAGG